MWSMRSIETTAPWDPGLKGKSLTYLHPRRQVKKVSGNSTTQSSHSWDLQLRTAWRTSALIWTRLSEAPVLQGNQGKVIEHQPDAQDQDRGNRYQRGMTPPEGIIKLNQQEGVNQKSTKTGRTTQLHNKG